MGRSENICRRGERVASSARKDVPLRGSWVGEPASSRAAPKMSGKSVRKKAMRGAGMLSVGANTMPTLRTVILLMPALFTISMRKEESCCKSSKLAPGSL